MRARAYRYYACDFETTVYEGQTSTEVWSAAMVELNDENVEVYHSISDWWQAVTKKKGNLCLYFHNLKFDGHFIIDYFLRALKYKQAFNPRTNEKLKDKAMTNGSFKYAISDMGQWYTITVRQGFRFIEIRDSFKLMPFSLEAVGEAFKTKHRKLEMKYEGKRYAGCDITEEEMAYIKNDVLVMKEALEYMFAEGHNKLTIGSCCLEEWKSGFADWELEEKFPNLYEVSLDESKYGCKTEGDYIHKAYRGAWCYLAKGKECKRFYNGVTADVNSLYPSVMHSDSGNLYPIGKPEFWSGDYIPETAIAPDKFYFVRVRTKFYLKPGMLPCIQVKNNPCYKSNEWLESSEIKIDGKVMKGYYKDGVEYDSHVTMTLTMMDWQLIREHYELIDCQILGGCWFHAESGMFDDYLNKYKKIKMTSKGAKRTEAKLFQNNLYGKMAMSTDSSFKVIQLKEKSNVAMQSIADQTKSPSMRGMPEGQKEIDRRIITFSTIEEHEKTPGYIPIGAAITSYARVFTITAAQANYHGADKPGFIYADTDSIHCDLAPEEVQGITVHPTDYLCWKLESKWDVAWFARQKTYIEHVIEVDLKHTEVGFVGDQVEPYYNITCAGMGKRSKSLLAKSLEGERVEAGEEYSEREAAFVNQKRELECFREGLIVPGKLIPTRMPGGLVLKDSDYEMN